MLNRNGQRSLFLWFESCVFHPPNRRSFDWQIMRLSNILVALTELSIVVTGTTVWIERFSVNARTEAGDRISFKIDPMTDITSINSEDTGSIFAIPGGISWVDENVVVAEDSVLGMGPGSAFMTAHQVVTLNPTKGKMIVGPYDASGDCREGRMSFADQRGSTWLIPLELDGSPIENASGEFQLGYYNDVFVTPQGFSREFNRLYGRRAESFRDEGREYSREDAIADSPVIHMSFEAFEMELMPEDYLLGNSHTTFFSSRSRDYPILPTSILNRMVVQLDRTNNRLGICTPH